MDREEVVKKMKALYAKAAAARKEGKADAAKRFKRGGRRLQRALRGMPEPVKDDEGGEAEAG